MNAKTHSAFDVRKLFAFLFVTGFGSSLSAVAGFLQIEPRFSSVFAIGLALSLKTLTLLLLSYNVHRVFHRLGLRRAFFVSQIFGLLSLFVLGWGFDQHSLAGVLAGICLTGIPGGVVTIGALYLIRTQSDDPNAFRKVSGQREALAGSSLMLAGILAPLILRSFGLTPILIFDGVTYLAGMGLTLWVSFGDEGDGPRATLRPYAAIFEDRRFWVFNVAIMAGLLVIAYVPLMAGSTKLSLIEIPQTARESLWAVEGLFALLASQIYIRLRRIIALSKFWELVLVLSSLGGLIYGVFPSIATLLLSALMVPLAFNLNFMKFRDDLLLSAGDDRSTIEQFSSMSMFSRSLVSTISPLFLSAVFGAYGIRFSLFVAFGFQVLLYAALRVVQRPTTAA